MKQKPREEGAWCARRAIEATCQHGLSREVVLAHYLGGEGAGIQGALNAAVNTYGADAPAEVQEQFVIGWVTALLHARWEDA